MGKGFLTVCSMLLASHVLMSANAFAQPVFKQGEVIVKLKPRLGVMGYGVQAHEVLTALGKRYALTLNPLMTDKSIYKVTAKGVTGDVSMEQLLTDLAANPAVQYAEPNFIYHTMDLTEDPVKAVMPNDPNFSNNWGLLNIGQKDAKGQEGLSGSDIGATKAWNFGTGSKDIVVAVIDTGVDYNHPDLQNNIFVNTKEDPSNGKDNDGNGFVNDIHGWNFEGKNNDPMDDNRHGTHCSGTIGAEGGNGVGTAGVNWHVSIMPIKFLSASGSGSLDDAVESINYATMMGVKIMSNSWGGGGYSQAMFDAIKKAHDKGILFVAAAGNDGGNNDSRPSYPASYELDNVISVAATDNRDQKPTWSNYGANKVHLAAPGVSVYSTVPVSKGSYDSLSGTSMACPHVSGAAALLWSLNTDMNYGDIKGRLMATVDPVRNLRKKALTGGRLNVYNAIANIIPERKEPPASAWKPMSHILDTAHPYLANTKLSFDISHPGAKYIRVHFSKIDTEASYDLVKVLDSRGNVIEELSGKQTDYTTDYFEGDKLKITFTSDSEVNGWGFAIDRYEFID